MNIKFSPPDISQAEIDGVVDTLKSGWITTGPKTKEFERKIAAYCGTAHAVCLNSATAGLELVLRVLGIGAGDEVITSAYTYTASASVIAHVGAKIVLCDTAADGYEMDYDCLETLVNARTKAIISVDIAGVLCDYERLTAIAERKKSVFAPASPLQERLGRIAIIADAAHSFGSARGGRRSGVFADFTSFSFHAVKNLTTAEGGAVVWTPIAGADDAQIYKQLTLWSLHGQDKDALTKTGLGAWEYDILMCGNKCNMTDIMAAIGLAQLARYPDLLARRKQIIAAYDEALRGKGVACLAHSGADYSSNGHLYLTRVEGVGESKRNEIIAKLAAAGVAVNVHYKPLPMMSAYRRMGFDIADYPRAYALYENEITLPLHTLLADEEVAYVTDNYLRCIREVRGY